MVNGTELKGTLELVCMVSAGGLLKEYPVVIHYRETVAVIHILEDMKDSFLVNKNVEKPFKIKGIASFFPLALKENACNLCKIFRFVPQVICKAGVRSCL